MKGFRTLLFNGGIAVLLALLQYVAGVDWTEYVDPTVAGIIAGVANIGLRAVTNTPIGRAG